MIGPCSPVLLRVDRAAPAVLLEHPVVEPLHAGGSPIAQPPKPSQNFCRAVRVLRRELDVHDLLAHLRLLFGARYTLTPRWIRAIVLYDEAPDPERYERARRRSAGRFPARRSATGASSARRWASRSTATSPSGSSRTGRVQGGGAQRRVHGDRQGRDGDGRPLHRHVRRR